MPSSSNRKAVGRATSRIYCRNVCILMSTQLLNRREYFASISVFLAKQRSLRNTTHLCVQLFGRVPPHGEAPSSVRAVRSSQSPDAVRQSLKRSPGPSARRYCVAVGIPDRSVRTHSHKNKTTPWPLVSERTIPTDRPPLVDEI
jgi:hypothetical protein